MPERVNQAASVTPDEPVDVYIFMENHHYLTLYSVSKQEAESLLASLAHNQSPVRVGRHLVYPNRVIYATIKPLQTVPIEAYAITPAKGQSGHDCVSSKQKPNASRRKTSRQQSGSKIRPRTRSSDSTRNL